MGFGIRVFLVDDDDRVNRFSYARLIRLMSREKPELMPEMANRKVRCAIVLVETTNRQPERITNVDFLILRFDKHGRLDPKVQEDKLRDSVALFEVYFEQKEGQYRARNGEAATNVLHAVHTFEKRKYDHRYRWSPTDKILKAIGAAVFGTNG
jgi:hypothetical protein